MITIYTDGSFRASENKGGYGLVAFDENDQIIYLFHKQFDNVTNNQMELKAIIHAFEFIFDYYPNEECIIYSDSSYCVKSINEWSHTWAKNGWINSKKESVKNLELMKILYEYNIKKNHFCQVKWLKGHANNFKNELADSLATDNLKKTLNIIKEHSLVIKES